MRSKKGLFLWAILFLPSVIGLSFQHRIRDGETVDPLVLKGHQGQVTDVEFLPDGSGVLSSGLKGEVRIWDLSNGWLGKVILRRKDEIYDIEITPDGQRVLSTALDGSILVSDIKGKRIHRLDGLKGWSVSLAAAPDSRSASAWSMSGEILIWDLESGRLIKTLEGRKNKWGMSMDWSPDGKILACGRVDITLWDVETGQLIRTLQAHQDFIQSVDFSASGKWLASAGFDKKVCVWDVITGELRYTLEPEGFVHFAGSVPVINPIRVPLTAVAFSPDERWLATAGADRMIRFWDAESGEPQGTLKGHTQTITAMDFSPDGQWLATSSLDRTVRLWKMGILSN